jgi:UDP-N-acetylglucosamine 2-epimerase
MREVTERSEALASGSTELVGTAVSRIVARTTDILDAAAPGLAQISAAGFFDNPFGDGKASDRIVARLEMEIRKP